MLFELARKERCFAPQTFSVVIAVQSLYQNVKMLTRGCAAFVRDSTESAGFPFFRKLIVDRKREMI